MNGFKKWIENFVTTSQTQTLDFVPSNPKLSMHASTPLGVYDVTKVIDNARGTESKDFRSRLTALLEPIDPYIFDRRKDGKVPRNFSGTPQYVAPEEAIKLQKVSYEHESDQMEDLLKNASRQFVWLEKDALNLLKRWIKFRSVLHVKNEAVNPVIYQVALLRLKTCEQQFPKINALVQSCEESDEHVDLIIAWNSFYRGWEKFSPTFKYYLLTFEKTAKKL